MTTYALSVTAMAFILAALLLREKLRRTEATEEAEVLREQFKDLRTIIENYREDYMRAYTTLQKAGYTDNGHPLWTPPPDLESTAQELERYIEANTRLQKTILSQWREIRRLKRINALAALRDRCVSDDWPPYGHGIEAEAKAGGE